MGSIDTVLVLIIVAVFTLIFISETLSAGSVIFLDRMDDIS